MQLMFWLTPSSMSSLMIHCALDMYLYDAIFESGRAILTITQPLGQVFKAVTILKGCGIFKVTLRRLNFLKNESHLFQLQ